MAKEPRTISISSTVTVAEGELLNELDGVITESRASFIRKVVIREAKKVVRSTKKNNA